MEIQYALHPDAPPGTLPLAARVGDLVFVGGQMAIHPTQGVPEETKPVPGYPWHGSSIDRQVRYIYTNMARFLEELGSSIRQVMKINSYHVIPEEIDMALRARKDFFGDADPPPSTLVLIPETLARPATVVLDVTTLATDSPRSREPVHLSASALGPHRAIGRTVFIEAVRGGGLVFTQGTTASRATGPVPETVHNPDFPYRHNQIKLQTELTLESLRSILEAAGTSFEHVVRAEIYLSDIKYLAGLDEVWERYFPIDPPARLVIPLFPTLARPDALIEIELIAVDPQGPYEKETVFTDEAPTPLGPVPQAVKAGPYLFLSGQLATDYQQGIPPEARPDPNFPFHSSSIKRQVSYIYKNVEAICRAAGTSLENLVKRRAVHLDLHEAVEAEEVWTERLGDRLPPTTTFRVDGPLTVPGCLVQYDLTVCVPGA